MATRKQATSTSTTSTTSKRKAVNPAQLAEQAAAVSKTVAEQIASDVSVSPSKAPETIAGGDTTGADKIKAYQDVQINTLISKLRGQLNTARESAIELAELMGECPTVAESAAESEFMRKIRSQLKSDKTPEILKTAISRLIAMMKPEIAAKGSKASFKVKVGNKGTTEGLIQIGKRYSDLVFKPGQYLLISTDQIVIDGKAYNRLILTSELPVNADQDQPDQPDADQPTASEPIAVTAS